MNYRNIDCIEYLTTLPDKSIDLVIADPPYYRVVKDEWDKLWSSLDDYADWTALWVKELERVAKHSCNLWLFGYPRNVVNTQLQLFFQS